MDEGMLMLELAEFLGVEISALLARHPYDQWCFERSVEESLPQPGIGYTFHHNGLAINCDDNEKITSIFLFKKKYRGFIEEDTLFSLTRAEARQHLGDVYNSGPAVVDPLLGRYGPYDLFVNKNHAIHVTYGYDNDCVEMVTLMTLDVMPV